MIFKSEVRDLSTELFRKLERLNMKRGLMREVLQSYYHNKEYMTDKGEGARVYVIFEGEKVIAWALVFVEAYRSQRVEKERDRAYFYVRTTHRRKGLGSQLAREVVKDFPLVTVQRWTRENRKFFNKVNLRSWHHLTKKEKS